jgi:hypothetical protein
MEFINLLLLPLFALLSVQSVAQSKNFAPAPCLDSTIKESGCMDCAALYFFGGEDQLMRYLNLNLGKQIKAGVLPSGRVSLRIVIDTLGRSKEVSVAEKFLTCELCNTLVLQSIERVHLWEPDCYYSILDNKILCREKELTLNLRIKDKKIYLE